MLLLTHESFLSLEFFYPLDVICCGTLLHLQFHWLMLLLLKFLISSFVCFKVSFLHFTICSCFSLYMICEYHIYVYVELEDSLGCQALPCTFFEILSLQFSQLHMPGSLVSRFLQIFMSMLFISRRSLGIKDSC